MSKQSEAKGMQGWRDKPDTCRDCENFEIDIERIMRHGRVYHTYAKGRCALGGFEIRPSNICNEFHPKVGEVSDGS
ncbi:hypothetical protein ACVCII_04115 [Burkholderia glumae]|uniref:hypothetical protein n=1 Tax=Burkholderia glumae TaxID=337 RepID=UPI002036C773|nr:hypothetical protein [Burkholderia glumae]MCM2546178.1 hypothetical protein [Burkholderia glumae]